MVGSTRGTGTRKAGRRTLQVGQEWWCASHDERAWALASTKGQVECQGSVVPVHSPPILYCCRLSSAPGLLHSGRVRWRWLVPSGHPVDCSGPLRHILAELSGEVLKAFFGHCGHWSRWGLPACGSLLRPTPFPYSADEDEAGFAARPLGAAHAPNPCLVCLRLLRF